jgi:hypothetical protein
MSGILVLAAGLAVPVFSQEGTGDPFNAGPAPEFVRQPQQGEAPRYPRDMVIGELGRGTAPEDAWLLARGVMDALLRGVKDAPALAAGGAGLTERLFSKLEAIAPEKYRIGGGRVEADGGVSFLVRFLGREQSVAGELYLAREAPAEENAGGEIEAADDAAVQAGASAPWRLDDLILEAAADLAAERDMYQYDFSPYERVY